MKKFAKIFVAVAGLFVGFACTTDVTEDLGVNLGGQTVVTLSLDESRTSLGAEVNDLYPVMWSSDDAISINGVKSSSIAVAQNAATATFTFNTSLKYPYCVAYPAAAEGKVVFADQQTYTDGSFADGTAAMYGYAEANGGVTLHHLTGVLKIGVTGNKTLTYAQISTADRAPIAGEFDIDFTTGEVTATKSSKEVISYSFPEDLVLASVPQYLHVTVPAGVYDELYVTLFDTDGGVMYATVKAGDSKPLTAGKIREFSNSIVYSANASVFVVKDKTSLLDFASQAASLDKDVLFIADVDMSGEAWTPIEGYAKTVIGNGYAINGLTAPLFGTTSASFKGLHLTNVALNSNSEPYCGGLARKVVATSATLPTVEHCSVSGTLTIENKEYAPLNITVKDPKRYAVDDTKASEMAYGALVGLSCGVSFSDCVNNVAITVNQIAKDGDTTDIVPAIGGITGNAFYTTIGEAKVFSSLTNCENNAAILYNDSSCSTDKWEVFPAIGGICGAGYHQTTVANGDNTTATSLTNCINRGNITFKGVAGGQGQDTQGYPQTQIGGVSGRGAYYTAVGCKNHGKITIDGTFLQGHIGGVFGSSYYSNVEDCHNFGEVYLSEATIFRGLSIAGVTAMNYSDSKYTFYIKNCSNNAPVNCFGSNDPNATVGGTYHYRVGGVEAFGRSFAENLTNNKGADITIKGNIIYLATGATAYYQVGGVTAYRTTCSLDNCDNYANVTSEINFTINSGVTDTTNSVIDRSFFIGGVGGYSTQQMLNSENYGNVTVKGSYAGEKLWVGGVAGYASLQDTCNRGTVTIDDSCSISVTRACIGGVLGGNDATTERTGITNYGELHIGGNHTSVLAIGGIAGQCRHGGYKWVNEADLHVTAYSTKAIEVAGIINYFVRHYAKGTTKDGTTTYATVDEGSNGPLRECTNNGDIYGTFTNGTGHTFTIGGICKQGQHTMSGCVNNGNAYVTGKIANTLYFGGVVAVNSACLRENCVNNGNITVSAIIGNESTTGADCFLGGLCYSGGSNTTYTNCVNNGNIHVTKDSEVANRVCIGGIIPNVETADKTNTINGCTNNGNITFDGKSSTRTSGTCRIGGMFGQFNKGTMKFLGVNKNTGNVTCNCDHKMNIGVSIGGIFGGSDETTTVWHADCDGYLINEGTVSFTGKTVGKFYMGGISAFFSKSVPPKTIKLINTGDLIATGTSAAVSSCTISGISGGNFAPIENAQCFCNIYAPNYGTAEVGMLSGRTRSSANNFPNAKVGGTICVSQVENDDTKEMDDVIETITTANFMNYVYQHKSTVDWSKIENYDGITVITSKSEITYPSAE